MKPSFDTWTSIFLFAAIQGFFISIILMVKNRPLRIERILLAAIVLLFSLTLADYVLFWTKYDQLFPSIAGLSSGFTLLYGPLFYYYFKIIFENHRFVYSDLLSLIPFLIHMITLHVFGINLYLVFHFSVWAWISIISMCVYAGVINYSYRKMSKIQQEISSWFNYLYNFYLGFIVSFTSYFILILTPFFDIKYDYMISFSMSFFIYFISWFGYMQPKIFAGFSIKDTFKGKYSKSALTTTFSEDIIIKLNNVMAKEKLYKDEDINLEKLALLLNISRHHLSQIINDKLNLSYFDYINSLRVKEAAELLSTTSKKEKNVLEIAYEAGFRNKATFNNAFKKITGLTPSEFREKKASSSEINLST